MTPQELSNKLRDIERCCRANACDIDAINEELTNIQIVITDYETRITILEGANAATITIVANYSALPDPATVPGEFYFTENSQGTKWLPGSMGGTYYPGGVLYYSNGVAWITGEMPWNAPQVDVDAGLDDEAFVTSKTLANATTVSHPGHTHVVADITDYVPVVDTSFFENDLVQDANRSHDQASFNTEINNANDFIIDRGAGTLASYLRLYSSGFITEKTTGSKITSVQTTTDYSRIQAFDGTVTAHILSSVGLNPRIEQHIRDAATGVESYSAGDLVTGWTIRAHDGVAETSKVILNITGTVQLDSTTDMYILGDGAGADLPPVDDTSDYYLGIKDATGQIVRNTKSVILLPALSADGTYSGITEVGTAGDTIAFGDLCYLSAVDSRWELADATVDTTSGGVKIGMCVQASTDGNPTTILLMGKIRADAKFPAMTISAPLYVSLNPGEITVTQPSGTDEVIRIIGHANTADELYFNPSNDWMTHI